MRPVLLLAAVFLLLPASTQGDSKEDSPTVANRSSEEQERHPAPQVQVDNAPPEAQLSPPPDAEKVQIPPGYIAVGNPAFPVLDAPKSPVLLGRRYDGSDLAPYFSKGQAAQAKAEFDKGHFAAALKLLGDQGNSRPVRYLRALSALKAESWELAAGEMSALAKEYPVLRDRCLFHAATALEELRRFDDAAEKYRQLPPGSKLFPDAQLGLARALRRKGDLDAAIQTLSSTAKLAAPAWGRDLGAEALTALADLFRETKKGELERSALID
ncbi:MAG TPA: tetratricopeptide repeat protein, partial [Myxococcaceae bacterium]|nr:tetratricopeptide repeat protein [Myxococcaceae bacterium]